MAQGVVLVVVGGPAVDAEGVQAAVPGDLGDGDEVFAAADELSDEGVAPDMEVGPEYERKGPRSL
jgi:hypothetical protein